MSEVLTGLARHHRHATQVIDLLGDRQRMIELLLGVQLELAGDVHVLRTLEHLGIDDVGDDRLVFARQIFIEQVDELFAGDGSVLRQAPAVCWP